MADTTKRQLNPTLQVISGLTMTLLFHGGMIAAYLYWDSSTAEAIEEPDSMLMQYEPAELLMYGEVMPEPGRLPRHANPAPEERPEEVVQVDPPEPAEDTVTVAREEPEEAPVAREERNEEEDQPRDSSRHNPNRPTNRERLTGSPDGFRGGTSLSATALANLFGRAQRQIQNAFSPPGSVGSEELARLEARVLIRVNRDGRVTGFDWERRSGNRLFDSAVERAINTFRLGSRRLHLPSENAQAMRQVLDSGFIVVVTP
jgi:outer membrane biosynthesis protein TonB